MNDFTKEELQEIKRCLSWVINCKDTHYTSILESMIENYDDNKSYAVRPVFVCSKCHGDWNQCGCKHE